MKIVKLLALALLIAGNADAQYFQHLYGGPRNDYLESGVNAAVPFGAPQGHIMTGYTDQFGLDALMLTSTDLFGAVPITPNTFNNWYRISENGVVVDSKGRRVVQYNNPTLQLGVWGDFGYAPGAPSQKFFYMSVAPNGTPISIHSYALPFPIAEVEATSMCQSTSGFTAGDVFVCGWVRLMAGGARSPIVMRLNAATGTMVWGWQHVIPNVAAPVDWFPMDLVESPYPNAVTGTIDIALTGHFVQPFAPILSGCFFTVDVATGVNTSNVITYGTTHDNGAFNAIDVANNPYGTGNGFVLGGYFFNANVGNDDSWAMKIDPTGTIINFTYLHDYNPSDNNYANDIIERRSPVTGLFEYYLGGYVNNGVFGGNDDVVFKLTGSGGGFPFGQFTFGGHGNEQAFQLDKYDFIGPNNDGLSVFGNTDGGSWPTYLGGGNDFYLVKSYFNAVTACNYDTTKHDSLRGPGIVEWWRPRVTNPLRQDTLRAPFSTMRDSTICFTFADPAGNNSRMAQTQQALALPGYFPNPVSRNNAVVTVTFGNAVIAGDAEIELWNSLGQLCWTKKSSLTDGQTQMQIELGNELSGGMYHLIVRQNGSMNNYRILIQ